MLDEPNMFQLIPSIQEVNQIHLNAVQYIKQHELHIFNSLLDIHREIYEDLIISITGYISYIVLYFQLFCLSDKYFGSYK